MFLRLSVRQDVLLLSLGRGLAVAAGGPRTCCRWGWGAGLLLLSLAGGRGGVG
jgi:hypothetical protein